MTGAYAAIGAVMMAVAAIFFARAGKDAEPAQARRARLVGGVFAFAGLLFIAAGLVAILND